MESRCKPYVSSIHNQVKAKAESKQKRCKTTDLEFGIHDLCRVKDMASPIHIAHFAKALIHKGKMLWQPIH